MNVVVDNSHVSCPTCGAKQPLAAECRRCKCDLRLYVGVLQEHRRLKNVALQFLREGEFAAGVQAAERFRAASPEEDAGRLVAVAYLLAGRYDAALDAYNEGDRVIDC